MHIQDGREIGNLAAAEVHGFSRKYCDRESDALFIACTTLGTLEVLNLLEEDLHRPVISANQATIWASLRLAGVRERTDAFGELLAKF